MNGFSHGRLKGGRTISNRSAHGKHPGAAGSGRWLGQLAWLLFGLSLAKSGRADPPEDTAPYLVVGPSERSIERLAPRARAWLSSQDALAVALTEPPTESDSAWTREELGLFSEIEAALLDARELTARFDEAGALSVLHAARERLTRSLDLPFAHAWLAELQVQEGLHAAQLGQWGLSETALSRAASLDPRRVLQAAEAPPAVIELAMAIARARADQSPSRARVLSEPEQAQVWLDGQQLGTTPANLEVAPGVHVLVVRAAGHVPYARLLELPPGQRPPIEISLAPTRTEQARRALVAARTRPAAALDAARTLSRQLGSPVWLFRAESASGATGAALRCADGDCRVAALLNTQSPTRPHGSDNATIVQRQKRWWKRWPMWLAVTVAVAGGAATIAVTGRDSSPRQERVLTVDPGTLPQ